MHYRKPLLAAAIVLFAWVALAQPRRGKRPPAPEPPEQTTAESEPEQPPPPKSAAKRSAGSDDLGEPPPKPERVGDAGVALSPLTPRADEFSDAGALAPPADYDRLLGDIASLRSRVAALTTTLFKSKLRVSVQTRGDDARITSFVVTLDDGVVYRAGEQFAADDEKVIYELAVAPGHHVLGFEIEHYDARGREYKTFQSSKFSVVVPESKRLSATVLLRDDSDMAENFKDDQDGEYDVRVRLRAKVID